ncbi:MAG: S8 family peptidase [Candidatus Methanoplasma sp.]|jgi:hypothetical protein|nr:S8 family peptidase [Candidatus Methanoplasma sp.]
MKGSMHLPIQVVSPRNLDYSAVNGGGSTKELEPYTPEMRESISKQCMNLKTVLNKTFLQFPAQPCVGKVVMKEKAIAKTHKPTELFKEDTCPIIGTEMINEILIKVTPDGLDKLIRNLDTFDTKKVRANITKIESIMDYSVSGKINIQGSELDYKQSQSLKIKLFTFDNENDNLRSVESFENHLERLGIDKKRLNYGSKLRIYKLNCIGKDVLREVAEHPAVHKISLFPSYVCGPMSVSDADRMMKDLPKPDPNEEYPVIGMIDSGIKPDHEYLEPWVYKRVPKVSKGYRNYGHGTFVAGMLEYGANLNNLTGNGQNFKILDVIALPNGDPTKGNTDELSEDLLVEILHDVVGEYHDIVKVWNLSLGTDRVCVDIVSDLAVALDEIQDQFGVNFIVCAGNYVMKPFRGWPPLENLKGADRITSPADSARAITVGSIANKEIFSVVAKDMPSPFSRKGPGANSMTKPDVVCYGGNCTEDMQLAGVISFDTGGDLVEIAGTSYSAPLVTNLYAGLCYGITEEHAQEFAKALLIHSATIPEEATRVDGYHHYYGHGIPEQRLERTLSCTNSEVTLIFSGTLRAGTCIEFNDFPYPHSLLRNGRWYGNIKMTLVYTPKLNPRYGQEYCRVNIEPHLGTYDLNSEGKVVNFKGMVPQKKRKEEKYEKNLFTEGYKWNPHKKYFRNLKNGIESKPWRLMIDSVARDGESYDGQDFVLIVTITDLKGEDIYSDVVQMLRERGYIHAEMRLSNRVRQRIGL